MANRHLSRSVVLQTLFEWDFRNCKKELAEEALERNAQEFASGASDLPFMEELLDGTIERKNDLDMVIEKAAPEWPLDRIALVDRNVLRLGLYELLFSDREKVPAKVAINEAIELAKNFGGENSGRFVNGVLGAVYKELGEPGKDEVSKKRKDIPYEELPVQHLGGAVVYAKHQGEIYLALVHDIFGHWTLSKGKVEKDEDVKDGTFREIKEEMGLEVLEVAPFPSYYLIGKNMESNWTLNLIFEIKVKNLDFTPSEDLPPYPVSSIVVPFKTNVGEP